MAFMLKFSCKFSNKKPFYKKLLRNIYYYEVYFNKLAIEMKLHHKLKK